MNDLDIKLGKTWADATYDMDTCEITIDTNYCKSCANKHNMSYIEYVARCINHETLHHIMQVDHSERACHALDNIAKKNIEYWMW